MLWILADGKPVCFGSATTKFIFDQMPASLSKEQFCTWWENVNMLLSFIDPDKTVTDCLTIRFSDEEKKDTRGTMSLEDVKAEIRRIWNADERLEGRLAEIRDIDDVHKQQAVSALAEIIHSRSPEYPYEKIRDKLEELFGNVYFEEYILGEYRHREKTIVLYTRNIERTVKPGKTVEQNYETTFIHELFHAYHYQDDPLELTKRKDYTSDVVKESLAAAFEWNYCVVHKIPGTSELRYSWEIHSVTAYPYSGAKYLIDWARNALQDTDFCNIFNMSLVDMDGALRMLVRSREFYGIKNLIFYCETVTDPPAAKPSRADLDALYANKKVGTIAREEIPPIITAKNHLISKLLDRTYCKKTFDFDTYTILSPTRIYKGGNYRYFPEKTSVGLEEYFVCSQWYEKHRKALLDWIWQHR